MARTVFAPARWLSRAVRVPGTERHALTQALKAGLAAALSWVAAVWLLHLPQPFLAPYASLFAVEATVYRSLRTATRQLVTVVLGVVLAWLANQLLPMPVALPLAVLVGLLVARWHWFGPDGIWIVSTAVLVLSVNAASGPLLLGRLVETLLGVVVGTVLNAVLFPPVYRDRAVAATARLGEEMAGLLHEMAKSLREDTVADRASDWVRYAEDMRSLVEQVGEASELAAESRRLNLRKARPRYRAVAPQDDARRLVAAWPHVRTITQSLRHVATGAGAATTPDRDSAAGLADLLDSIAEAVELATEPGGCGDRLAVIVGRNHEQLDELERRAEGLAPHALAVTLGLGGLAPPLRGVLNSLGQDGA
ncbi:FUSC family protein [Labedaea rhizosphaerae]|uniref:Uncharacterized membrane protein YgaE (UPF0421/DUF939 family) n=1 Tax=Labedaea rhizosphaerae TaxID=598644 RepID=A0A4R6SH35_LABRH|nr:aromatic acid exporter family protein [Labedaea rhizosphaerae]TDQ00907.1 uncharacterized membrane protein YgaE (UPF0421/DUF939 family) [Labedaea rhizosphaerae]